jgi:hypothetical protein
MGPCTASGSAYPVFRARRADVTTPHECQAADDGWRSEFHSLLTSVQECRQRSSKQRLMAELWDNILEQPPPRGDDSSDSAAAAAAAGAAVVPDPTQYEVTHMQIQSAAPASTAKRTSLFQQLFQRFSSFSWPSCGKRRRVRYAGTPDTQAYTLGLVVDYSRRRFSNSSKPQVTPLQLAVATAATSVVPG